MKYWECIDVPGKTNTEGVVESTPSSESNHVLAVGNIEPSMRDAVEAAARNEIDVTYSNEFVNDEKVSEFSDEYKRIFNQAFSKGDGKIEPVTGTDGYSVSVTVPENASGLVIAESPVPITTTEKTPEEIDALKYVSADEVDPSKYNIDPDFEAPDVETPPEDINIAVEKSDKTISVTETSLDRNALLQNIFSNGGEAFATSIAEKVVEKVIEPPEPEYSLDDEKLGEVIDILTKYEEEYFKELPIKHLSNRFLRNITKDVYRAHQDCVDKYEAPPLMDPLFLLYPLTTEDPYMALGKFWEIVTDLIESDELWSRTIVASANEYDDYMRELAEEDEDEDAAEESVE